MVFHRHDLFLMYEATKVSLQITRYTVNASEYYSDLLWTQNIVDAILKLSICIHLQKVLCKYGTLIYNIHHGMFLDNQGTFKNTIVKSREIFQK